MDVEVIHYLRQISRSGKISVCDDKGCVDIYNPEVELEYNSSDLPVKVTVTGVTGSGETVKYYKELVWDTNPLSGNTVLKRVTGWTRA